MAGGALAVEDCQEPSDYFVSASASADEAGVVSGGDGGEEDDLESLADKDAVAKYRPLTLDEVGEQEELAEEARWVVMSFLGSLDEETKAAIIRNKVDEITFEVWAKRTGKDGEARLRTKISRAYRKMRQKVPPDLRRALVQVYQGGDWEYAKQKSDLQNRR